MKKIFSLLIAILFVGSMFAAEESVDFSAQGYENGQAITSYTGTLFSVAFDKGTNNNAPKYYTAGSAIRCYGGNTFTVSSSESIVKIELTFGNSDGSNAISADKGTYSAGTWTGSATSVVFTIGGTTGNRRLAGIKVTTGEAPSVVDPVITGDAFFYDETTVTITCSTDGATIYYTLDGSDPTDASAEYTDDFKLTETKTVKAIAIKGDDKSQIAEKTFTKNPSFASFDELIAAGLATNTLVEVSFANLEIDSIYSNKSGNRQGVYFAVNETKYEIYYSKVNVPEEWIAGGTISGTIRGNWTYYSGGSLWELVPSASDWQWTSLTYKAPTVDLPKIEIWGEWDDFTKHELTPAANNKTASYTVELTEVKDYQFAFIYEESSYYLPTVKITRAANEAECDGTSGNAKIEADYAGEYTFTWTYATNTVTVTYPVKPVSVTSIELSAANLEIVVNKTKTLTATVLPDNATDPSVTWESDDESVATVADGVVTAVAVGVANITCKSVSDPTVTATCEVAVVEPTPTGVFELYTDEITAGKYLITYDMGAMNTTVNSDRLQFAAIDSVKNCVKNPDASIVWTIAKSGDYWTLYNEDANAYAASTGAKNKAQMLADGTDDKAKWTITVDEGVYEFVNKQNHANGVNENLRKNGTYGYACYATGTGGALTLFKWREGPATSVDNTVDGKKAVKFIQNGQLFIEMNGRIYNVQGQTVK